MSDISIRVQGDLEAVQDEYVELSAKVIYTSINAPMSGLTLVYVPTWDELSDSLKATYRDAARSSIAALLVAYYREEEALAAQKAEEHDGNG